MNKPLVLIVDDNVIALKLLRKFFEASGMDVIEAIDGHQCIALAAKNSPHVILLDVMMPMMDGYETIRRLKDNDKTKDIPVIILTALNDTGNQLRAIESGADDFLSKPIEEKLIITKVKLFAELGLYKKQNLEMKNLLQRAKDHGALSDEEFTSVLND